MTTLSRSQIIENVDAMESQGASRDEVQEYLNSLKQPEEKKPQSKSFLRPVELAKSIAGGFEKEFRGAVDDISEAQQRQNRGEQGAARTAFTIASQGAQAGLSGFFGGAIKLASAAVPDFIENPLRKKLGKEFDNFIETDTGKRLVSSIGDLVEKVDTFDPKNQQLVKDAVDAGITALDLSAAGITRNVTKKVASELAERTGTNADDLIRKGNEEIIERTKRNIGDLIIDDTTPTKRSELAVRTKEGGFFSGREIELSDLEQEIAEQLVQTQGIKSNRSALFNLNAVVKEVEKQATQLKKSLKEKAFIAPKKEFKSRMDTKLDDLVTNDPNVVGDAEAQAKRIFTKAKSFIDANSGTGLGQLEARQQFDAWALSKRPKSPEKSDAFSVSWRAARDEMTDFLVGKAKNTDVKASLKKQSLLLGARDVLRVRAGKESAFGFVRLLDKATDALGTKNRIVQLLATAAGIGGLGAAATFAPAVAALGGVGGAGIVALKALRSPQAKIALGKVIKEIEKTLPNASVVDKAILEEVRDEVTNMIQFIENNAGTGASLNDVAID